MDKPVFNLSNVSRGWRLKWTNTQIMVTEMQLALGDLPVLDDDTSAEERREITRKQIALMREMQELAAVQGKLLAEVLVDVPGDWVVDSAPDGIDWSDADNLDYLREDRYADLVSALATARREDSKN